MITIGHGAGGRLSQQLIRDHFLPRFDNPVLAQLADAAVIGDLALTTDGYVVSPRFFPGGDLGRLAACGTINDLVMSGSEPIGLTAGFILEEGLAVQELDRLVASLAEAAQEAGVPVVAGDTKVVARGACDGVFITTSGVGRMSEDFRPAPHKAQEGDAVLLSGTLADHGMAVMAARGDVPFEGPLRSDVAPLAEMVSRLRQAGLAVHVLRDPTRGGAAQCLLEVAQASGVRIVLEQESLPVAPPVRVACELLGLDPLHVANEGKLLAILPAEQAQSALDIMHGLDLGSGAVDIGRVASGTPGLEIETGLGVCRAVRMPQGEILPRIC